MGVQPIMLVATSFGAKEGVPFVILVVVGGATLIKCLSDADLGIFSSMGVVLIVDRVFYRLILLIISNCFILAVVVFGDGWYTIQQFYLIDVYLILASFQAFL